MCRPSRPLIGTQTFLQVLIDHVLYSAATEQDPAATLNVLTPHILSLSKAYSLESAQHFISKLVLMQKNLVRGLAAGAQAPGSKTWPGLPEMALLRLVGLVWSTSDFSHPVVAPAMLLMCQYLNQCRVRSLEDVKAGLFLCTLCLQVRRFIEREYG
jgi:nucleolar protein 14